MEIVDKYIEYCIKENKKPTFENFMQLNENSNEGNLCLEYINNEIFELYVEYKTSPSVISLNEFHKIMTFEDFINNMEKEKEELDLSDDEDDEDDDDNDSNDNDDSEGDEVDDGLGDDEDDESVNDEYVALDEANFAAAYARSPINSLKISKKSKKLEKAIIAKETLDFDFEKKKEAVKKKLENDPERRKIQIDKLDKLKKLKVTAASEVVKSIKDEMDELAGGNKIIKDFNAYKKIEATRNAYAKIMKMADEEESKQLGVKVKNLDNKLRNKEERFKEYEVEDKDEDKVDKVDKDDKVDKVDKDDKVDKVDKDDEDDSGTEE